MGWIDVGGVPGRGRVSGRSSRFHVFTFQGPLKLLSELRKGLVLKLCLIRRHPKIAESCPFPGLPFVVWLESLKGRSSSLHHARDEL